MRILSSILLTALVFACNPYEKHASTHYYIQAEVIPDSAWLSANVQIVFVPKKEYTDSIIFRLNSGVEIHSLASQELEHYMFGKYDREILVLNIEDPVKPNDQLHISLSYSGRLHNKAITSLDTSLLWYPVNDDTRPFTYHAKIALPGKWKIVQPEAGIGKRGKWLLQEKEPCPSLVIDFLPNGNE